MTNDGTRTSDSIPQTWAQAQTRALAEAAAEGETGRMSALSFAATVVLVRDGADGPEVLLIERPNRGSFAGAWVFPGGKIDPEDADGFDGEPSEIEVARRAGVREVWEEIGLVTDETGYETLSCWVPPASVTHHRIRTWFFVAVAPEGELTLSPHEAVAARWIRPADALALHTNNGLSLFPPTWVTLASLVGHVDAAAMVAATRDAAPREFMSRSLASGKGLLWEGDAAYDSAPDESALPDEASTDRHRLDMSSLPWVYLRKGTAF